jgi:hypothetical protein
VYSKLSYKAQYSISVFNHYSPHVLSIGSHLNFWHRSFIFNSNKSPTWCTSFSVYYPYVCLQLNKFREFSRPSSGAQWLQWQSLVLPSYRGDSRAAVIELLMMGGKAPETCWAVNKRQENKLKNWCIRLVIYLNCTMMRGLTNLYFYIWILAHPVCEMWIIREPKKVAACVQHV